MIFSIMSKSRTSAKFSLISAIRSSAGICVMLGSVVRNSFAAGFADGFAKSKLCLGRGLREFQSSDGAESSRAVTLG